MAIMRLDYYDGGVMNAETMYRIHQCVCMMRSIRRLGSSFGKRI